MGSWLCGPSVIWTNGIRPKEISQFFWKVAKTKKLLSQKMAKILHHSPICKSKYLYLTAVENLKYLPQTMCWNCLFRKKLKKIPLTKSSPKCLPFLWATSSLQKKSQWAFKKVAQLAKSSRNAKSSPIFQKVAQLAKSSPIGKKVAQFAKCSQIGKK